MTLALNLLARISAARLVNVLVQCVVWTAIFIGPVMEAAPVGSGGGGALSRRQVLAMVQRWRLAHRPASSAYMSTPLTQSDLDLLPVIMEAYGVGGVVNAVVLRDLLPKVLRFNELPAKAADKRVARELPGIPGTQSADTASNDTTTVWDNAATDFSSSSPTAADFTSTATIVAASGEENGTRTTVVVVTSGNDGVNLKVLELIAIVAAVFLSGFIVGGISVWLMAVRRRRKGRRPSASEVVANPIFEHGDVQNASMPRYPSLRTFPPTISAITHRFHRPGYEEGYFVPDEGWAVITANIAVEDVHIPFGGVPGAVRRSPDQIRSTGRDREADDMATSAMIQRSPQPSDQSLPAIEYSTSMQRLASGSRPHHHSHRRRSEATDVRSCEESMAGSIPEEPTFIEELVIDSHKSFGGARSYSLPDADIPEAVRSPALQGPVAGDESAEVSSKRHSVFKSCSLRRVSSDSRFNDNYRGLLTLGGRGPEATPPRAAASHDRIESQSEPGSPAAAEEVKKRHTLALSHQQQRRPAAKDGGSLGGAGANASSDWQRDDDDAGSRPSFLGAKSHTSAPPGLGRLGGMRFREHDHVRISPANKERVLSWIESQENILQNDFEVQPSSPFSQAQPSPHPYELYAADHGHHEHSYGIQRSARSQLLTTSTHHRSLDEALPELTGRAQSHDHAAPWSSRPPLRSSSPREPQQPCLASQRAQILHSASTGVMYPAASQTLESIVQSVAQHPLASPPDPDQSPSVTQPDVRQQLGTTSHSPPAAQQRSSLRPSVTLTDRKTEQRLSMHPVDLMEMDLVSFPSEDVPPAFH